MKSNIERKFNALCVVFAAAPTPAQTEALMLLADGPKERPVEVALRETAAEEPKEELLEDGMDLD